MVTATRLMSSQKVCLNGEEGLDRNAEVSFSVPKATWAGRASLVAIRGSGWARVFDGNSAAFWNGPANFGDHPRWCIYRQAGASVHVGGRFAGFALGVFETQAGLLPTIRPGILEALKVSTESAFISRSAEGPRAVHRYVVMEGAEPLSDDDLEQYLQRVNEGVHEFELTLARTGNPSSRCGSEQLRDS